MSDNQAIIDFPDALARTLGDVAFLQSMLFEFQSLAPDLLDRIHHALQAGDMDNLAKDAHQLKGSAANLGIKTVASIALELETIGKDAKTNGIPAFEKLKAAVDQFNALLSETDFSTFESD